jgi:putative FmdB family regulatory protein
MPTYEYACSSCQNEWEVEQSIKEDPIKECPRCHNATAKRQISRGGGFILKGSGWYADLYSSPSNKGDGNKKDEKASASSTTAEGSSASTSSTTESGAAASSSSTESSSSGSSSAASSGSGPAKGSPAPAT